MKFDLGCIPVIRELRQIRDRLAELTVVAHQAAFHTASIRNAVLMGTQDVALMLGPRYADPKALARHQAQVYSRHAQDGIIAEILRRIGMGRRQFVEIGVDDGIENNTRLLLQQGWSGVWVEADPGKAAAIGRTFASEIAERRLVLVNAAITPENANALLNKAGVPVDFDVLSVDIDMNTHHVWEALSQFRPRMACVEYNSSIPPSVDFAVPYRPDAAWTDGSNYFGAGLKALERIGRTLGYNLVGCDFLGVDAFFVRKDLCKDQFLEPFTAEFHYEPPRYALHIHRGHNKYQPADAALQR